MKHDVLDLFNRITYPINQYSSSIQEFAAKLWDNLEQLARMDAKGEHQKSFREEQIL